MTTKTESYRCESCQKLWNSKSEAESCEVRCHNKRIAQKKIRDEYNHKIKERKNEAIKISQNNAAIKILINHLQYYEARIICQEATRFLWDCGTSSGWECLYDHMIRVHNPEYVREW